MNKLILHELRHLILQRFEIRKISPSDCNTIALEISRKTKKTISATTIKRFFGFAAVNYQFSKFTVNTLISFLEVDLDRISPHISSQNKEVKNDCGSIIHERARLISTETLAKIKAFSTIPYANTIPRKFAMHDFDLFYRGEYNFTAFIAQSGFGKSILQSHLVYENFLANNAKYQNDIILYISAEKLIDINKDFIDIEENILSILGIETKLSFTEYFNQIHIQSGKKLVIVLESLYVICREKGIKQRIFDGIIRFLLNIESSNAIKFVFGARTYLWRRFYERIKYAVFLRKKWFPGSYYRPIEQQNVPAFTISEIDLILSEMNIDQKRINPEIKAQLRYTFNFEYIHQLKDKDILYSSILPYKFTQLFYEQKLLNTSFLNEKKLFFNQFIEHTNFGQKGEIIEKSLLMKDFHHYKHAYMDLLFGGIITEEKHLKNGFQVEHVKFTYPYLFEYLVYHNLIDKQKELTDSLKMILNLEVNVLARLKLCLFEHINKHRFNIITEAFNLNIHPQEFTQLMSFVSDCISTQISQNPAIINQLKFYHFDIAFNEKLMRIDFLDPLIVPVLQQYLKFSTNSDTLFYCEIILCLHDCFNLNVSNLAIRLKELQNLNITNDALKPSILLVRYAISKLNNNLSEYDPIDNQINKIYELTASLPSTYGKKLMQIACLIINWICTNKIELIPKEINQIINTINCENTTIDQSYATDLLSLNLLQNQPLLKFENNHDTIAKLNATPESKTFFTSAIKHLIHTQTQITLGNKEGAITTAELAIDIYKTHQLKAFEVKIYRLLIEIYEEQNDLEKVTEYKYLLLQLSENNQFQNQHLAKSQLNNLP